MKPWSMEEISALVDGLKTVQSFNWQRISRDFVPTRSYIECARYYNENKRKPNQQNLI
jgi:hypothetical protein